MINTRVYLRGQWHFNTATNVTLIIHSGVLAASVERSRQKWLNGGLFETYWVKPRGKKAINDAHNPSTKTMTKTGGCSMIVEPHVFEISLYTVKDLPPSLPPSHVQHSSVPAPPYNLFPQNYHYNGVYNYQSAAPAPSYAQQGHSTQNSLPPFREGFAHFDPQGTTATNLPRLPNVVSHSPTSSRLDSTGKPLSQSQVPIDDSKADPVIQMLATRAASDPKLKTLMKIVAGGKATQVELKEFQDHIDELNAIIKTRPKSIDRSEKDRHPPPPPDGGIEHPSKPLASNDTPENNWNPAVTRKTFISGPPPPTPVKIEPTSQTWPPVAPSNSAKPYSLPKPDITGMAFDIVGGTGDRFSFPRFSILEYLYGGTQVIVSFLVIRSGKVAGSGKYKDSKYYYQPITMRLTTNQPKLLEPLSRVVASPDEVRSYMKDIFQKYPRAETVGLAMRLPRYVDLEELEKRSSPAQAGGPLLKSVYSPPTTMMPLCV